MTRGSRCRLPARSFLAASVVVALLGGCAAVVVGTAVVGTAVVATDRRTSGAQVDDEAIALKASGRLDQAFPDGRVSVAVTSYNRIKRYSFVFRNFWYVLGSFPSARP